MQKHTSRQCPNCLIAQQQSKTAFCPNATFTWCWNHTITCHNIPTREWYDQCVHLWWPFHCTVNRIYIWLHWVLIPKTKNPHSWYPCYHFKWYLSQPFSTVTMGITTDSFISLNSILEINGSSRTSCSSANTHIHSYSSACSCTSSSNLSYRDHAPASALVSAAGPVPTPQNLDHPQSTPSLAPNLPATDVLQQLANAWNIRAGTNTVRN